MRISSLALAAVLFLASHASAQSGEATYPWQATGSNLTVLSAEQQYGGYITFNPYYTTGPNQYTMEPAFVGPVSGLAALWDYPTLPLRAATAHGDYITLYFAENSTVYFWNVTTMTQLGSQTVQAGDYFGYTWSNFDVPDTDTLGFVVVGADGSEAYIYLELD